MTIRMPAGLLIGLLISSWCGAASTKLPPSSARGVVYNDLPAPYNLQAVVLGRTITLAWEWAPPEHTPSFIDFGFEVKRHDGKTTVISGPGYSDFDLAPGTYTYVVRVRGGEKVKGKRVEHASDWSETAGGVIRSICSRAPRIELSVEPTKQRYSQKIPSLRLRLTGRVTVDAGCSLSRVVYNVDAGTGLIHTGPLPVDGDGRFDAHVDALGPDDEPPDGSARFTVTAVAENEAGPTTSNAYTLSVERQNPYAPR